MREIKCRGYNKELGKWIIGSYVDGFIINGVIESNEEYIAIEEWFPVKIESVGQYTGLKDKNGVEIYEGDIIKQTFILCVDASDGGEFISGYHKGEVVVIASRGVCIKNPILNSSDNSENYKLNQYKNVVGYRSEVIGNIYENSELLEVE